MPVKPLIWQLQVQKTKLKISDGVESLIVPIGIQLTFATADSFASLRAASFREVYF